MAQRLNREEIFARLIELDAEFRKRALPLRIRPLQAFKAIHGGVPDGAVRAELFEPITSWFIEKYGQKVVWDGIIGRIPIILRGDVYLVQVPFAWGTVVKFTDRIEDLPAEVASTLTIEEVDSLGRKIAGATLDFQKLYNLSVDDTFLDVVEGDLVWRALCDLENAAVSLKHTGDSQTTIFHAHAAAEKFLKVALKRSGSQKDLKSLQHKLPKIFELLASANFRYSWLKSEVDALQAFAPDMQIRYSVVPRTLEDAIVAFNAGRSICGALAQMWLFDIERGTDRCTFLEGRFYLDGCGARFYCLNIDAVGSVTLRRFGRSPLDGHLLMMDIKLGMEASGLYLEVNDVRQIHELQREYAFHMQNRGQQIRPEDLGIKISSGPEGSYVTGMVTRKVTVVERS